MGPESRAYPGNPPLVGAYEHWSDWSVTTGNSRINFEPSCQSCAESKSTAPVHGQRTTKAQVETASAQIIMIDKNRVHPYSTAEATGIVEKAVDEPSTKRPQDASTRTMVNEEATAGNGKLSVTVSRAQQEDIRPQPVPRTRGLPQVRSVAGYMYRDVSNCTPR
eukprot:2502205-Rhodomonas_salina.2